MWQQPPPNTPAQRRRSTVILIFVVAFFLLTIHDEPSETKEKKSSSTTPPDDGSLATHFQQQLEQQLEDNTGVYPRNLTGYFVGQWSVITLSPSSPSSSTTINTLNATTTTTTTTTTPTLSVGIVVGVPKSFKSTISPDNNHHIFYGFTKQSGAFFFRITKTVTSPRTPSLVEVQGSVRFVDGGDVDDWSLNSWSASTHGLYMPGSGKLTLFTNSWNYNMYLRSDHLPGETGLVELRNGSLVVMPDEREEERKKKEEESRRQQNVTDGGEGETIEEAEQHGTGNEKEKEKEKQCVMRIDMDVAASPLIAAVATVAEEEKENMINQEAGDRDQPPPSRLFYHGKIATPLNCPLNQTLSVQAAGRLIDFEALYDYGTRYGMVSCLVTVVQMSMHLRLLKAAQTPSVAQSLSTSSMSLIAGYDACVCVLHATIAVLFDPLFGWFAMSAMLKFVLFSAMELKFMLKIFVSRAPQEWENPTDRSKINARFYCLLLILSSLLYQQFSVFKLVIVLSLSFVVPQLVSSARSDPPRSILAVHYEYYLVALVTRLLLPLYVWSFGTIFFDLFPLSHVPLLSLAVDLNFAVLLVVWSGAQLVLLASTVRRGDARWYVAKSLLPVTFNYRRDVPFSIKRNGGDIEESGEERLTCAICFMPVDTEELVEEKREYMLTPCNHLYHDVCLLTWFDSGSLTCPVCRTTCPAERNRSRREADGE